MSLYTFLYKGQVYDTVIVDNPASAVVEKEGTQLGVIAQELEEIVPEAVTTNEYGVKSVNPDGILWHLVNAVKELSAKVNTLENTQKD